jgi:hypothetical protein
MDLALEKYELMNQLGIDCGLSRKMLGNAICWYHLKIGHSVCDEIVDAILERACREWLDSNICPISFESMGGGLYLVHGIEADDKTFDSFGVAQLEVLKYCLKENKND